MASKRRVNWVSQQRVDVPDVRAIESAVSNDFDELIQSFVTGIAQGYVLKGFKLSMAGAIGGAASGLQLIVDSGAVFHVNSSQSGTFLLVPVGTPNQQLNSATNTIVDGAFVPSSINYISLEYERYIDDSTSSQVYLWNPTTNNETTKTVPRASILRFRIKISTSIPASNFLPIAIVTTDSGNNVTRIDDARRLLFSQGSGGFSPNPFTQYTFPEGRTPNPTFSTSNSVSPFEGGDKSIGTLKDKLDAVTTQIQSIIGGAYWTSQNNSGSLESIREDLGNTVITGRGNISHSETVQGQINWSDDIFIRVVGSRLAYKLLANPSTTDITLGDDQAAYVNLVRNVTIIPNLVFTNGSSVVTSVGSIAWTGPLQSGDWVKLGSDSNSLYYQINTVDSLSQVTLLVNYAGTSTGASGAKAKYSYGSYSTSATPSSDRDIYVADRKDVPSGENVFWLFVRSDNGGSVGRVYVRFLGSELQQGETEEISDNVPLQVLQYIGSTIETSSTPLYVSALDPGSVAQVEDLTFGTAAQIANNDYFLINSAADTRLYYVWFNKDAAGVDPEAPGRVGIEVAISTGMTAIQVANVVATAMNGIFYPDFSAVQRATPNQHIVRVTWASAGTTVGATDFNVGAPFAVTTITTGTGTGNAIVNDGDNLTLGIKKLDRAIGSILAALDSPSYDEPLTILAPVSIGTLITLPNNTRLANIAQFYTVGKGKLHLYLNGQHLTLGVDWLESGAADSASDQINIQRPLENTDLLEFVMESGGGGGGGGGGGQGPQGDPGPAGPPGSDAIGGPIAVSTKAASYTVQLTDNVLKANCTVADIIFTLPPAASATGRVFWFKKIDATAFFMRIQANGSELIDGLNIQDTDQQWESFILISDGTTWSMH